ncbi:MAG: prepilin peptidase [Gammaproteobacteria bacterium]|nr:prepilin peptidase [Gammaproteobacteria bacterium]
MSLWDAVNSVPGLLAVAIAGVGLIVGSFLNVVIHRLPRMLERQWQTECAALGSGENQGDLAISPYNLLVPRSRCPHCEAMIGALDNIPLLSYLFLRGRCRHCKARISLRYPVIEIVSCLMAAITAAHFGSGWPAVWAALLTWSLIALAAIDFDTQLLPDAITLPMLWLGLLLNSQGIFVELDSAVFGAALGYFALWSVYWLFKLFTGKEGMGYGDFKLLSMLGAWLGWAVLPIVILCASVVGAVVGLGLIAFAGRDRAKPIPFGPYLAAAGWLALLWGEPLSKLFMGGATQL